MNDLALTAGFALVAAGATMVGGVAIVLPAHPGSARIHHGIAFGAGFMLAAVFVSMIPESFAHARHAAAWILVGYALAHLFTHTFTTHFHFGEETHPHHAVAPGVSLAALVGLGLHAFFDGVAISAGFLVDVSLGVFVALAVILHKVPEGVTIASLMMASGAGRRRALHSSGILAAATLAGALAMHRAGGVRAQALALSSGIALYVAATDLIPEINRRHERQFSLSAGVGIVFYFGVYALLVRLGLHG